MLTVEPHSGSRLEPLRQLINRHLAGVLPGWSVPASVIARSLRPDPEHWVDEQETLCAVDAGGLVGAANVIRYGSGPEVSDGYRGAGEVAWLLFWPEAGGAAEALLGAARDLVSDWGASRVYACDTSLPVPVVTGVPESWPHVSSALTRAGFEAVPAVEQVLYGGDLSRLGPAGEPPVPGLEVRSGAGRNANRFQAELDGVEIAFCEWAADLSLGGALPALAGWAELSGMRVREAWRDRGIGTWLVHRAAPWLRLAGVSRVVAPVNVSDEANGAGLFCRRLGWEPLVRLERGWSMK